jgi:hypothetical protein
LSHVRQCPYCQQSFRPSLYRPQQQVCSQAECQRRRRTEYHRQKLKADAEYRQVVRDSQKKWRQSHPGYSRQYRSQHLQAVQRNRQRQKLRDRRRRIQQLAKNNLALDLKHSAAEVWLVGSGVKDLAKNNLASAQVFIFQQLGSSSGASTAACQEHPSGGPTAAPVYTASGSC